jgi:hypothetical protein
MVGPAPMSVKQRAPAGGAQFGGQARPVLGWPHEPPLELPLDVVPGPGEPRTRTIGPRNDRHPGSGSEIVTLAVAVVRWRNR